MVRELTLFLKFCTYPQGFNLPLYMPSSLLSTENLLKQPVCLTMFYGRRFNLLKVNAKYNKFRTEILAYDIQELSPH